LTEYRTIKSFIGDIAEMNGRVKENSAELDPRFMTSLARGLAVLNAFEAQTTLTVTQAARASGLPRSATARCLFTLEQLGYVDAAGSAYSLRPALLPLARAFAMGNPLVRDGQRVVDALRDKLGESSSLAMFDSRSAHAKVVYVCRAETARIISVPLFSGSTLPSYCTSNGRVLLAGLEPAALQVFLAAAPFAERTSKTLRGADELRAELARVAAQGWALTDGELEAGLRSIAVPLRNTEGRIVAALNLATQSSRRGLDWLTNTALSELQAAAAHLVRVAAA
jgi:IclR family pca regulon transcriptional regulator